MATRQVQVPPTFIGNHTSPQASIGLSYIVKKIVYSAASLFASFLGLFTHRKDPNNKELIEGINAAKLQSYKEALAAFPNDSKALFDKCKEGHSRIAAATLGVPEDEPIEADIEAFIHDDIEDFLTEIDSIKKAIEQGKNPLKIRSQIVHAMQHPVYQSLKERDDNPAIQFLRALAVKDLSAKAEGVLTKYGKAALQRKGETVMKDQYTFGELASGLRKNVLDEKAYHRDNAKKTFLWLLAHPNEAMHSIKSSWFPCEFDPAGENPYFQGFELENPHDPKHKMPFVFGPSFLHDQKNPGKSAMMEAAHLHMRSVNSRLKQKKIEFQNDPEKSAQLEDFFNRSLGELRENFQNVKDRPDLVRTEQMQDFSEEHKDTLDFFTISFDTFLMGMNASALNEFNTPNEFFRIYKQHLTNVQTIGADVKADNGFAIPESVLSEAKVKDSLSTIENLVQSLQQRGNEHWDKLIKTPEGKKRLGRMMQLATHAILSTDAVYNAFQKRSKPEDVAHILNEKLDADLLASRVSGACKQDIDRGVVENIALRLFFRLLTNSDPLSAEEYASIIGSVIARAELVEGRRIQYKRFEILEDLLRFFGTHDDMKALSDSLRAHLNIKPLA